ncbi:hypothetical protein [Sagittula sp. S175]|uniref:hypothetical protein n=1 Tax=Sagittula sp. S175 TaxID=3415129 RepID=UPI003C7CFB8E
MSRMIRVQSILTGITAACLFVTSAQAQEESALAFPSTFGAPSAIAGAGGSGFIGLTLVYPRRDVPSNASTKDKLDGDIVVGYTVGNPIDNISLTFSAAITSLTNTFGDSGALAIDLSRALYVTDDTLTFIGATASNLAAWGDARIDPEAYSIYVSHLFSLSGPRAEIPMQITVGYGDQSTYDDWGINVEEGWFYGIGVGLTPNLSASLSGTRNQLNIGANASLPFLPDWGISAGVYDVTDNVDRRQFAISISRAF